jgi:ferredoxin-fold anticodon binding domain-containing protein
VQREKKVSEVIERVALWRKFYSGFFDESGNFVQKKLDSAAQHVGVAKKTLDDYLLQIRNGKKYGFNFNERSNAKIGELRAFVRDEKKKETK